MPVSSWFHGDSSRATRRWTCRRNSGVRPCPACAFCFRLLRRGGEAPIVRSKTATNINSEAGRGLAIREFPLAPGFSLAGYGFADCLLYINGYAAGAVQAKKTGVPLIGVDFQTANARRRPPQPPS